MDEELARSLQVIAATLSVSMVAAVALATQPTGSTEVLAIVGAAFSLIGGLLGVHFSLTRAVENGD